MELIMELRFNKDNITDLDPAEMKIVYDSLIGVVHQLGIEAIEAGDHGDSPMTLLLRVAEYVNECYQEGHTLCIGSNKER